MGEVSMFKYGSYASHPLGHDYPIYEEEDMKDSRRDFQEGCGKMKRLECPIVGPESGMKAAIDSVLWPLEYVQS
jgi:hypothetical protein